MGRRLCAESSTSEDDLDGSRVLLTSRLADGLRDCSTFHCVGKDLDSNINNISSSASAKKLTKCKS